MYANEGLDITQEVMTGLNEAYNAEKEPLPKLRNLKPRLTAQAQNKCSKTQ